MNRVQLAGGTYYGPNLTWLASNGVHEIWYRPGYMGFAGQGDIGMSGGHGGGDVRPLMEEG